MSVVTHSSQRLTSEVSSWVSSSAPIPCADVRMITPKFFGRMAPMICLRRLFSSLDLIFVLTETLS